jgi:hypothetical protein
MFRQAVVFLSLVSCCALVVRGQPPMEPESSNGVDLAAASDWPLERIELKGGRVYHGLVRAPRPEWLEAAEKVTFEIVRRRPGQPMHLVRFAYPKESIAKIDLLPADERAKLIERLDWFRNRDAREARELNQLTLQPGAPGGPQWTYDGPWFRLEAWTDKEMTRLTILRIEQVFAAYSEILPPRTKPERALRIVLFGSMRDYAHFQKHLGIHLQNPAVYLPKLNLLAAGSELSAYAHRLADVDRRHATIRAQYDKMAAAMPGELKKLSDDLERSGVPAGERRNTRLAAERKWKEKLNEVYGRMQAIERSNGTQFDLVTKEMLVRLYHEAFHAYLENFVYPRERFQVPRCLNEGLAQVFEEGLLELGTLRLDAPSRERLSKLQADLRTAPRLPLAELLTADAGAFLVSHSSDPRVSERHYLYSWGLAQYLAMREPVLETARLDGYVDPKNREDNPVARFERLVGMPLAKFEAKWREEMLALKAP